MSVAGHGTVCLGFLFHRRRKTTNLIDNEIHVTAETIFISKHSIILARTVIFKHSVILPMNILRFWQGEGINRTQDILGF